MITRGQEAENPVEELANFGGWQQANPHCRRAIARGERFVYFIQSGERGPIKIGAAANPFARLRELQTGNPYQLRLLLAEDAGCHAWALERALHRRFASSRLGGEWFAITHDMALCVSHHAFGATLREFLNLNNGRYA